MIVAKGNDQVALTSKFEARDDTAGKYTKQISNRMKKKAFFIHALGVL